ncbi:MAG: hypothetical protein JWQ74_2406 [Marmoricola sp.]|nr:hypothetical protein [Marmoricola sp.]
MGPDDYAVAVRGDDPQHLVTGWPGSTGPLPLDRLPASVQALGDPSVRLALPAAGDPVGLAGPPSFNASAVDLGEAVIVSGRTGTIGLLPELDARTVLWTASPVELAPVLDPGEASRTLRQVLLSATAELVRLDVASWQPEIPDLLLNLQHRPELDLPPGSSADLVETLERATLCLDIVELARSEHGGAITAYEVSARARCLTELDHAARRAVVAFCSASLMPS